MKKEKNYRKNTDFARKEKFILRNFWISKPLILSISWSKGKTLSTKEIGRKIFL